MTRRRKEVLAALALGAGLLLDGCFIEPHWMKVTRLDLEGPGPKGLTAVFLADLHLKSDEGHNERWVLARLAEIRPDLILVGGDTVDDRAHYEQAVRHLSAYKAPLGVFVVPGNWEHWAEVDLKRMRGDLAAAGVTLLVNERRRIQAGSAAIDVLGVDDACSSHDDLDVVLKGLPEGGYRILLSHAPVVFDEAARRGVELTLAGHTHGGQVVMPCLGPCWLPQGSGAYVRGRYGRGASTLFVTSGVGTSILPVRFNCRPEIVVIRWK